MSIAYALEQALALCLTVSLSLVASVVHAGIGTGLVGTLHDFVSRDGFLATQNAGTSSEGAGLCTYCHTAGSALTTAMLWNHRMSGNTFSWDEARTAGGTPYPNLMSSNRGPSVKCLSCHDGTVAVGDIMLNDAVAASAAALNSYKIPAGPMRIATTGGSMQGNHPVGIPYPYERAPGTYNGVTTGSNVPLEEFQSALISSAVAMIKLYHDNGDSIVPGAAGGRSGIECSSCHDPHNRQTSDEYFLRAHRGGATREDGYICLQCHRK